MKFKVGDLVCWHDVDNEDPYGVMGNAWIGVVTQVDHRRNGYHIKQTSDTVVTTHFADARELNETLTTFEGQICIECWPIHGGPW